MLDRRRLLQASAGVPLLLAVPKLAATQETGTQTDIPNFPVAGAVETDPSGYEVAWSADWQQKDTTHLTFEPIPGTRGFVVLDSPFESSVINMSQRVVVQTDAASEMIDPAWLMDSFADDYPTLEMGYAPGTIIVSRHVADLGGWFFFASGTDAAVPGIVGYSLYYTPHTAGDPLMNVTFSFLSDAMWTEEHLEFIDSTISLNGNWLLGLDDLGAYWAELQNIAAQ